MISVYIKYPIWNTRSIGINKKIITDDLRIEILYEVEENGNKKRLYPYVYYMRKDVALKHPIQEVNGVKLCIIPIGELIALNSEQIEYAQYCHTNGIPFTLR